MYSGYPLRQSRVNNELAFNDSLEDLLHDIPAWQGAPPIVRKSLKVIAELLEEHSRKLQAVDASAVSKSELTASLAGKADATELPKLTSRAEFVQKFSEVHNLLDTKQDRGEIRIATLATADQLHSVNDKCLFEVKKVESLFEAQDAKTTNQLNTLAWDLQRIQKDFSNLFEELTEALKDKADKQSVHNALNRKTNKTEVDSLLSYKLDAAELQKLVSAFDEKLQKYTAQTDFAAELAKSQREFFVRLEDLQAQLTNVKVLAQSAKELAGEDTLAKTEATKRLCDALKDEVTRSREELRESIHRQSEECRGHLLQTEGKIAKNEDRVMALTDDLRSYVEANRRIAEEQLAQRFRTLENSLETLHHSKADREDVHASQPAQAAVQAELTEGLAQLGQLAERNDDELKAFMAEQQAINEAVCRENCVGRWIWKSGRVSQEKCAVWEAQTTNTCTDNFIWKTDTQWIQAVAPGLYQVVYGVFADEVPQVQLLVNGEVTIHGGITLEKLWGQHSAGNVVGLTCNDFIALPAHAQVGLVVHTEVPAEGFISLKKL